MTWEKFTRDDRIQGSNRPFIAVSGTHFAFSSQFVRKAGLSPDSRVTVFVDSERKRVGFEFHNDERPDSFALSLQSSHKRGEKRKGMQSTSRAIVTKHPWLKGLTERPAKERRFEPKQEGNLWVIDLSFSLNRQ